LITSGNGNDVVVGVAERELPSGAVSAVATSGFAIGDVDTNFGRNGNNEVFGGAAGDQITTGSGRVWWWRQRQRDVCQRGG